MVKKTPTKKAVREGFSTAKARQFSAGVHEHLHRTKPRLSERQVRRKSAQVTEFAGRAQQQRKRNGFHS